MEIVIRQFSLIIDKLLLKKIRRRKFEECIADQDSYWRNFQINAGLDPHRWLVVPTSCNFNIEVLASSTAEAWRIQYRTAY